MQLDKACGREPQTADGIINATLSATLIITLTVRARDRIVSMESLSLYIHIPFCSRRCAYCDFNTYSDQGQLLDPYICAVESEIRQLGTAGSITYGELPAVHTVYLGGGTPSLLDSSQVGGVLDAVREGFALDSGAEITVEANPESVDPGKFSKIRDVGVCRVSLGIQSFIEGELEVLGRIHDVQGALNAVVSIREAGFSNISLDLIYGIPGQTPASWGASLARAMEQGPEHLSLYSLAVEPGTRLQAAVESGELPEPDPDCMADMYEMASSMLQKAGYRQYEISNWALSRGTDSEDGFPGLASRHNLQYWLNDPYLGIGAGAHGFAAGCRTRTVLRPSEYILKMKAGSLQEFPISSAVEEIEDISRQREIEDTIMMGLRLTEAGVCEDRFRRRFGVDLEDLYAVEIQELLDRGLLERFKGRLRLSGAGRLLGNQVFASFIS